MNVGRGCFLLSASTGTYERASALFLVLSPSGKATRLRRDIQGFESSKDYRHCKEATGGGRFRLVGVALKGLLLLVTPVRLRTPPPSYTKMERGN